MRRGDREAQARLSAGLLAGVHGNSYGSGNAISWCHTSAYMAGKSFVQKAA